MRGKIAIRLRQLLYEACRVNRWWTSEMSIQEDHIHLVVQIPPQYSVAEVVQIFKGGTSRVLRKEYAELEEFLWGDSFWADGYFAETVGQVDEEVVKKYIRKHFKAPYPDYAKGPKPRALARGVASLYLSLDTAFCP